MRQLEEYLGEVGVEIGELRSMSKEKVKLKVHAWDEARWRRELNMRETLEVYRNKSKIHEEMIYNNSFGSVILFRCRTNTLKLNWRTILEFSCHRRRNNFGTYWHNLGIFRAA